jgi:hypothetical protein
MAVAEDDFELFSELRVATLVEWFLPSKLSQNRRADRDGSSRGWVCEWTLERGNLASRGELAEMGSVYPRPIAARINSPLAFTRKQPRINGGGTAALQGS